MNIVANRHVIAADAPGARAFDLLSVTVLLVLIVHAPHVPWWLTVPLVALLSGRWWQRRRRSGRVPVWLKLPLLALLTLAVVFVYGNVFGRLPGSTLAVGLLVLKLLESETDRDLRVGAGFACFLLMAALLFGQSLIITAVVALGLLPALGTLRALEPAQARGSGNGLLPSLALLGAAVPLALLAFVFVPRLDSPLWGAPAQDAAQIGLSDSMSPGNFTDLLIDDRPAMRVSFDGAPPERGERYFRAYVLWNYDGRTWRRGSYDHSGPAPLQVSGLVSSYRIALQPSHQRVLPALDMPVDVSAQAMMRADREIIADKPIDQFVSYTGHSSLHYRLQPMLDDRSRRIGLQSMADFNPRTRALALQWRGAYGNRDAAIVQAALSLFHDGGFRYTLAPAPLGREAVDDFLFGTREGFCEHYASAFTVLMRDAGIPARVVTGYQGGFWNRYGQYLLVRNSDAHAWSEVWLAGRGWVRVDPTAAVRPERVTLGAAAAAGDQLPWQDDGWLESLKNRWDIVNRWWDQGVIGFDALRQRGMLTRFGARDGSTSWLGIALAIGTSLFMAIGLIWAMRRRRPPDALRECLRMLERKLARAGVRRAQSEGPQHFFTRAARTLPQQRQHLMALMASYLTLRYAHDEPPPEPLAAFRRAVRDFRVGSVVK